jgi:hypothetical protein
MKKECRRKWSWPSFKVLAHDRLTGSNETTKYHQSGESIKRTIFWNIMLCRPLKVNWHFGRTYGLHPQGRRTSRARYQVTSRLASCSTSSSALKMEATFPQKLRLNFNGLCDVTSQKIVHFITTAVRTSDPRIVDVPTEFSNTHFSFPR